jgi:hypothetical protein
VLVTKKVGDLNLCIPANKNSQRSKKRSLKAKRVEHLQNDISEMNLKIVAQMLNPYRWISLCPKPHNAATGDR